MLIDCALNDGHAATIQATTSMNNGQPVGFCSLHFNRWCDFLSDRRKLGQFTELDYREFIQECIRRETDWIIGARS